MVLINDDVVKKDSWILVFRELGFADRLLIDMCAFQSEYVKSMNLGGAMIWALDLDDYRNLCGQGHYPLLSTIMKTLGQSHGKSSAN